MRSHRAINRSVRRVGTTALALAVVAVGLAGIGLRADRAGATPSEYFSAITFAGGNGSGSAASQLDGPGGVAVDGDGNVYVADTFNSRVQRWAPGASAGVTVAGGNGSGSAANQVDTPFGVAVDGDGNVYVADTYNPRVQKLVRRVSTVAGGNGFGSAADQLAYPYGVAVDGDGNVYVADTGSQRVQRWAPGASVGVTVAGGNGFGSAANQLVSPGGVAVDGDGNVYVVDSGNARVQRWAPGASAGVTVAGGNGVGSAANQLDGPGGVAVDGDGNVYVADSWNARVQRWAHLSQTVTFGTLDDRASTAPAFALSAAASSGLPVTLSSRTESVCTVTGTVVFLTGATGACTIRASQAGTEEYVPAVQDRSFAVKDAQTITFSTLKDRANTAAAFEVTGTASSGLSVAFSSSTLGVCTVTDGLMSLTGSNGTCTIRATQAGDGTYLAATAVERSFDVTDPHAMVIRIGDLSLGEGSNTATTVQALITASAPLAEPVCVWWRTSDVTATGVDKPTLFDGTQDYMRMGVSKPKFALLAANRTVAKTAVKVNYDGIIEEDETFRVIIDKVTAQVAGRCDATASADARIKVARSIGTVTILDDDIPE